jgi:hypothetical protein
MKATKETAREMLLRLRVIEANSGIATEHFTPLRLFLEDAERKLPSEPTGEPVVLTEELLRAGESKFGWNRKQIQLLGVDYPPGPGWIRKLIGTTLHRAVYEEFIKLKF